MTQVTCGAESCRWNRAWNKCAKDWVRIDINSYYLTLCVDYAPKLLQKFTEEEEQAI